MDPFPLLYLMTEVDAACETSYNFYTGDIRKVTFGELSTNQTMGKQNCINRIYKKIRKHLSYFST
jgi:hypothetical protein